MNLKKLLTIIVIVIAIYSGFSLLLDKVYVVPILTYHNIDGNSKEDGLSVSPKSFERQMKFLRDYKYNVIPLDSLVSLMNNKMRIPRNTICVTFDDGKINNYNTAYPILKKYNIPADIFITVDHVGKSGYMDWPQIQEMYKSKINIGSHSLTHPFLQFMEDKDAMRKEIRDSKNIIESKLKEKIYIFAYPLGGFNGEVRKEVIDAGYIGAVGTNLPVGYPDNDRFVLPRLRISKNCDNMFVFWFETNGYYTFIKNIKRYHKEREKKKNAEANSCH